MFIAWPHYILSFKEEAMQENLKLRDVIIGIALHNLT